MISIIVIIIIIISMIIITCIITPRGLLGALPGRARRRGGRPPSGLGII